MATQSICRNAHRACLAELQAAAAEEAKKTASVREAQRAAIATPGRRTPAHTPRKVFGL